VLNWPLYQGDRVNARIAREQAQFHKLQAGYDKLKMGLSQALLENWLEIEQLQKTVRSAAKKQTAFRDLALERSRAVYELELKTNLGDSMAATVEAKLRERHTEYQLALAFARLEALLGKPLEAK
jgi:outer membrane protein TolC